MSKVSLDALIRREDFEVSDSNIDESVKKDYLAYHDFKNDSFLFANLRKPDFQRETNEWDSARIASLIQSFIDGDLIPAVILWQNKANYTFVIDGAHRISALASWINNDYGDGTISKKYYDGIIPEEQVSIAEKTRKQIRQTVGLYSDYELAIKEPDKVDPLIVRRAQKLGTLAIKVQWVQGDAKKAEDSFFKINKKATPISPTEMLLLQKRHKPTGIATRAILRSGSGHKYWSNFNEENKTLLVELATKIYNTLFDPELKSPIKTLEVPLAGKQYGSKTLLFDFVNIVAEKTFNINKDEMPEDKDGNDTIKLLKACLKMAERINSIHPSSLGLHPLIYFYTKTGRYKPASFYAIIEFIYHLEAKNLFNDFIKCRDAFETVLLNYDYLIQQIVRQKRGAMPSKELIADFYSALMSALNNENQDVSKAINIILNQKIFKFLVLDSRVYDEDTSQQDFSTAKKNIIFIKSSLDTCNRCKICKGYLHNKSITVDHIERKSEGGKATVENGQLAHPYCNTTFKH